VEGSDHRAEDGVGKVDEVDEEIHLYGSSIYLR
jgi:hypothetical protein